MAVPKKKVSKSRKGMRRSHDGVSKPKVTYCSCGEPAMPHRACPACGKYKGQQVVGGSNEQ